jgi:hypothetical protein
MKLKFAILALALAWFGRDGVRAQTTPLVRAVGCPANVPMVVMAVPSGIVSGMPVIRLACVPIDSAKLAIDASGKLTVISGTGPTFVDSETPAGVVDGANAVFTLVAAPNPLTSLALYRSGFRMKGGGVDYTLTTPNGIATITFVDAAKPLQGDVLVADYRR